MMPQSPIDDRIWKVMFHTVAVTTSAAVLFSLWREKRDQSSKLNGSFAELKSKDPEVTLGGIQAIISTLDDESRTKKGASILTARQKLRSLLPCLKYVKNSDNDVAIATLRLIRRICNDAAGRTALASARGYRAVLVCLSEAHKNGHVRLMEEAAKTLEEMTQIDTSQIVLAPDVPPGSEGALELAVYPATVKMLRTLEPGSRVAYLSSVCGALANITTLQKGAKALQKGTDNKLGVHYFLQLITHSNEAVVDKAARALRFLLIHDDSQHEAFAQPEHVRNVVLLLVASSSVQQNAMRMVYAMLHSPKAPQFFETFEAEDGLQALFRLWTKATDKQCRDMAESLVHMMEKIPFTAAKIRKLFDLNRGDIQERRAKDEEIKRKQMEQARQQQMMRQAMMREMMGGMDVEGMMGEE